MRHLRHRTDIHLPPAIVILLSMFILFSTIAGIYIYDALIDAIVYQVIP